MTDKEREQESLEQGLWSETKHQDEESISVLKHNGKPRFTFLLLVYDTASLLSQGATHHDLEHGQFGK